MIICGDFNFPEIDWIHHLVDGNSTESSDSVASRFYDLCQDSFLHQHVSEFTRKRGRDEPSLLDLILTENDLEIDEIKYDVPIGKSDHSVLIFDFTLEEGCEIEETNFRKRNFFKGNYSGINLLLKNTEWFQLLLIPVQKKWDYFYDVYTRAIDSHVPWMTTYNVSSTNQKWMTRDTNKALNEKSDKWNNYRTDKTPENYAIYSAWIQYRTARDIY